MEVSVIPSNTAYVSPVKLSGGTSELGVSQASEPTQPNSLAQSSVDDLGQVSQDNQQKQNDTNKNDLKKHTDEMNQIVAALNPNLQFTIHDKTKEIMIQFVNVKNNKVLKEFPSHEFLDMVAKIRDYVGMILDKKV